MVETSFSTVELIEASLITAGHMRWVPIEPLVLAPHMPRGPSALPCA